MAAGKRKGSQTSTQEQEQHANGTESLGEELGSAATEASASVQDAAGEVTQNLRQQLTSQVTAQQERAVDTLEHVALLLQQAGEHARKEDQATIAQLADQASEQVERFSTAVRDREPERLLADTKQLAQTKPGLFVGGALLAGFLGARFLRSSAQPQTQDTAQEQAGSDQSPNGSETAPTGAYGSDVPGSGPYGADISTTADAPGMGATGVTTGLTDPTALDGTLLEEDAVALEELEQEELLRREAEGTEDITLDSPLDLDGEPETR